MSSNTVLVTGGNGLVGTAVRDELDRTGYHTVSLDTDTEPSVDDWAVDLLDSGAVHNAVSSVDPGAIVHVGTLPHPLGRPGHETYESNAMTTYNVLEAAADNDVGTVALASSINALGAVFQEAPIEVEYLPVDEDHPLTPRDPYALGKRTIELQAEGFARREGPPYSVVSLRLPFVAAPEMMQTHFAEPDRTLDGIADDAMAGREDLYSYIARSDAARAFRRAIEADVIGHEPLFVTADDTTMRTDSPTLAAKQYPAVTDRGLSGRQSLISNERARTVLGWEPRQSWRNTADERSSVTQ